MPPRDPGVYLEDIENYAAAAVHIHVKQYLAYQITRSECGERRDCGGNFAAN